MWKSYEAALFVDSLKDDCLKGIYNQFFFNFLLRKLLAVKKWNICNIQPIFAKV